MIKQCEINLKSYTRGFHLITDEIRKAIQPLPENGITHVFIKHTSAGLTINENADSMAYSTIFEAPFPILF